MSAIDDRLNSSIQELETNSAFDGRESVEVKREMAKHEDLFVVLFGKNTLQQIHERVRGGAPI